MASCQGTIENKITAGKRACPGDIQKCLKCGKSGCTVPNCSNQAINSGACMSCGGSKIKKV